MKAYQEAIKENTGFSYGDAMLILIKQKARAFYYSYFFILVHVEIELFNIFAQYTNK